MPGYEEHKMVGGFVGGATALVFALEQPPLLALAETVGGIVAGRLVANWPDVLEPAVSSHHRDAAHAVGPMLLAGSDSVPECSFTAELAAYAGTRSSRSGRQQQ